MDKLPSFLTRKNALHKLKGDQLPYSKADLKGFKDHFLFDEDGRRLDFVVSRTHNMGSRKLRRMK